METLLLAKGIHDISERLNECLLEDVHHSWRSPNANESDSALYVMVAMLLYDGDLTLKFDSIGTVSLWLQNFNPFT